jgi:hypothetical protein
MKYRIWENMLTEVVGAKEELVLVGEVEANSPEEAKKLAEQKYPGRVSRVAPAENS